MSTLSLVTYTLMIAECAYYYHKLGRVTWYILGSLITVALWVTDDIFDIKALILIGIVTRFGGIVLDARDDDGPGPRLRKKIKETKEAVQAILTPPQLAGI